MKTNITTPKKKLFSESNIFYVPSKSGGEKHIVVKVGKHYFCDCKDFMTRRLPLFETAAFSHCVHGKQVIKTALDAPKTKTTYGVFTPAGYRSVDIPGIFDTLKDAQEAIETYERHNNRYGRVARAL